MSYDFEGRRVGNLLPTSISMAVGNKLPTLRRFCPESLRKPLPLIKDKEMLNFP